MRYRGRFSFSWLKKINIGSAPTTYHTAFISDLLLVYQKYYVNGKSRIPATENLEFSQIALNSLILRK